MDTLKYTKDDRGLLCEVIEYANQFEEPNEQVKRLRGALFSIIKDCNILESEVERLREENETLKKQMEDDLK